VVGTGREQARAAVLRHHPELRHDVLSGVLFGKVAPEPKAADCAQLGGVVQDAAADPGDLVEPLLVLRAVVAKVVEVGGVVESVADPCPGARGDDLREHGPVPELDRSLVRPVVADEAQPHDRGTHEAATGVADRADEAADQRRLEIDVVVQEQHVRRTGTVQERLAMLREAAARDVADQGDGMALGLEDTRQGDDLG
jgi:hypothetical protein